MKKTITILYVEDNLENRILIRRILQAEGFHMLEAENAYQALSLIRTSSPDLILMDINMPGMDGYSLTEQLKSQPGHRNIPIVALTANVMKGDKERTFEAGCDGYIQKPIDVDLLPLQVRRYLER